MRCRLVYSPGYDFSLFGIERLHPFDARRASRAWSLCQGEKPDVVSDAWLRPTEPVTDAELALVHTQDHLTSLRSSSVVARALEAWPARLVPNFMLQKRILSPMRLATRGTLLAAGCALRGEITMNFGGGYHHAFRDHGEGFCLYADVALAIAAHRAAERLGPEDRVAVVDLDAHRGNGFEAIVADDATVRVLDMFNVQAYPGLPEGAVEDRPFMIPIRAGTADDVYLSTLEEALPRFLADEGPFRLAFYNAGTDVVVGDKLGGLALTPEGVKTRDRRVVDALTARDIPTVILPSGGYSQASHALIAALAMHLLDKAR
jgi:histone deacetylase 11